MAHDHIRRRGVRVRLRDDRDIRKRGIVFEIPAYGESVDARQHDVKQDQIGKQFRRKGKPLPAVRGAVDLLEAVHVEVHLRHVADGGVVFNHQDLRVQAQ